MTAARVVIKKYENRRLYDTTNSRYVNLEDIAEMVRAGTDVQVVDANSGEDLTRLVLTQIIVEHAKEPDSAYPVDFLRQMIMASGNAGKESLVNYMQTVADMYQNAYRTFAPSFPPFSLFPGQTRTPPPPPAQANTPSVEDLYRRIQELEQVVADSRGAKPKAKKPVRKRR